MHLHFSYPFSFKPVIHARHHLFPLYVFHVSPLYAMRMPIISHAHPHFIHPLSFPPPFLSLATIPILFSHAWKRKLAWLPPLQHPRKYPYFYTHLHANPTPHQASLSSPTNLVGAAFGVRRRCFSSERLSLGRRRRPARHPLRLLPRRGRQRHRRRHPSTGAVASKAMYLHRLDAALEAATPSLSSTSLLVEVSSERAAQMEGDASGCDGACVGDRLGLAHDGPWAWVGAQSKFVDGG